MAIIERVKKKMSKLDLCPPALIDVLGFSKEFE